MRSWLQDTTFDNISCSLFEKLSDSGIIPYYLHQLDRLKGTAHFEVPEEEGRRIMKKLSESLSGYALPRYVKEIAGSLSKTILF